MIGEFNFAVYQGNSLIVRLLAFSCIVIASLVNETFPCDSSLIPDASQYAYRLRDSVRCEGLYRSDISGELKLVSIVAGDFAFADESEVLVKVRRDKLQIAESDTIRIQANSTRLNVYYRMDAVCPLSGTIVWPISEVLRPLGLKESDVGVFAWYQDTVHGIVYIPTEITNLDTIREIPLGVTVAVRSILPVQALHVRVTSVKDSLLYSKQNEIRYSAGEKIALELPRYIYGIVNIHVYVYTVGREDWIRLPSFRLLLPSE